MQIIRSCITTRKNHRSGACIFLFSIILVLIFISTKVTFSTATAGKEPLLVRVGAYANPPKIYMDQKGRISGFWPELIERIARTENWKIQYVWGTWSAGLDRLKNKEIDILPDVAFTEKRGKLYTFSQSPVLTSWARVYVNRKNTEIQSIADLKNRKIAVLKGAAYLEGPEGFKEIASELHLNCKFLELNDYTEVLKAIEDNRADAGITNRNFGNRYAGKFRVKMTSIIFFPCNLYFAFPKEGEKTPFLVKQIDARIKEFQQNDNSPYYRLLKKFFETEIAEEEVPVLPGWLTAIMKVGGFLLLLFILVIIVSRIQVRRRTREIRIKSEALRESTQLLSAHLLNTPVGAISWDLNFRVIDWNPAAEAIFGYTKEEASGNHFTELIVPEDMRDLADRVSQDLLSGKGGTHSINENRTKDGRRITCEWYNTRLSHADGKITGVASLVNDITEQRQAEEALRQSRERYSALVEESFDGIIVHKGVKIIFANRRLYEMLGYAEGDLVGLDHWLIYHPEFQELVRTRATARMRGEVTPTHYEVKMQRKDGSWFCAEIAARVLTIEKEPGVQVWIRDITERKEAEEHLRKNEARLRSIFEALPLGIGLVQDRRILWHNETISRMLGYSREELHETNSRMFYENDDGFERVGKAVNSLGPGKRTADIETRWVRKDGSVFDCRIRCALMDPESEDRVVLSMAEDITERKKAEKEKARLHAQLNQSQKMEAVGVLAGGVAHDFNNLLTTIIGNADLALMDLGEHTSAHGNIAEILRAGHRAAALTRQLLAFSRKELVRPEVLDLNRLLMDFEKMLRRIIGEDIEMVTAYAPDPWKLEADPGQMEQVVMNLAVNAKDAMPKGGKLTIETANVDLNEAYFRDHGMKNKAGSYVMLAVTDTGSGMDEETQGRIFEPFFTTKGLGKGTGLGLSTVYGIVKQNRGYIWVYSEPGKGTAFKVYLPKAHKDVETLKTKPSPVRSLEGSETILVVDDDEMLRKMAERMLGGYGYRVLTARNGEEALEISGSRGGSIRLVLTDVIMPGMSGPEMVEQLRSMFPETKVVYMSGYTDNVIARHGILEDGIEIINKPFTREYLAAKVREVLDRKQH